MQQRPVPWIWIALAALVLLFPGPLSRLLIDVVGGITLTLVLLPLLLGAAGWLGWQILRRRLQTCEACGFTSVGGERCPACGTPYASDGQAAVGGGPGSGATQQPAAEMIVDVQAVDVSQRASADQQG